MNDSAQAVKQPSGGLRYSILTLLFVATTVNYADRATLSIAGTPMQGQLGLRYASVQDP